MSCKINGLDVSAIKYGSQNITKVMQNGNVLWQLAGEVYVTTTPSSGSFSRNKDGDSWSTVSGLPNCEYDQPIAYGNGRFVLVNENGASFELSRGSRTWMQIGSLGIYATGIAYGNGMFVAVTEEGKAYRLSDGSQTWVEVPVSGSTYFCDVVYANGRFVALGYDSCCFMMSDDESSFIKIQSTIMPSGFNGRAAYGSNNTYGEFIMAACEDKRISIMFLSNRTWQYLDTTITSSPKGIAFGNNRFVIVGNGLSCSFDMNRGTLSTLGSGPDLIDVVYTDGKFVAVGTNVSKYLLDGSAAWINAPSVNATRIAYGE